jgi:hypothetical protein
MPKWPEPKQQHTLQSEKAAQNWNHTSREFLQMARIQTNDMKMSVKDEFIPS